MSSLAASRAKTSAKRAGEPESTVSDQDSGRSSPAWFARYDRATCSWRTRQCSLLADLDGFSETWPRWGMMRDGVCSELTTLEPRTEENAFGFLPTPCATDAKPITGGTLYQTKNGTIRHMRPDGRSSNRGLEATARMLPTPTVADSERSSTTFMRGNPTLRGAVLHWSTPTVSDCYTDNLASSQQSEGSMHSVTLAQAVKKWPTPTVTMSHGVGHQGRNGTPNLQTVVGGKLNPLWVAWLMGVPIEWLNCAPLETRRFRQWSRSHGKRS